MSAKKKPAKPSKKPVKKVATKRPPAKTRAKPVTKPPKKQEPVTKKKEVAPKKGLPQKPAPAAAAAAKAGRSGPKASRKKAAPAVKPMPVSREAKPGLGYKWVCFACSAKFYDMEKPEPLCPRCGADQRTRPAQDAPPPPPPAPRRPPPPPMARYLEEEEAPAEEAFVDEGEEEAAEIDIEAIEESGTFVEPDYDEE